MELVAVRRPVTTADELSPSRRTLVGDWELMAFEGPQRQRKKMIRSKRKLILARDRRGENTSDAVADGCVPEEGSGGDVAASTAVEVPPTVDEDSDVIVVHTAALSVLTAEGVQVGGRGDGSTHDGTRYTGDVPGGRSLSSPVSAGMPPLHFTLAVARYRVVGNTTAGAGPQTSSTSLTPRSWAAQVTQTCMPAMYVHFSSGPLSKGSVNGPVGRIV